MKTKSKGITFLGILFCLIGILWLGLIYQRGEPFVPKKKNYWVEHPPTVSDYRELKKEMRQTLQEVQHPSVLPRKPYLRSSDVMSFWMLVSLELICSFLYILAGISLLRGHVLGRWTAITAIYCDIIFKVLIWIYVAYFMTTIPSMGQENVVFSYFLSAKNGWACLASFLTGLKIYQPSGGIYLFTYLAYIFGCFHFLTRPKAREHFLK
ncbi:MAG: hypothetical protein NUV91_08325 [Candidatus Omnitrophica bacterium]|nr:hypothetical protein [Candidatus Omnitrophota bacterium]